MKQKLTCLRWHLEGGGGVLLKERYTIQRSFGALLTGMLLSILPEAVWEWGREV